MSDLEIVHLIKEFKCSTAKMAREIARLRAERDALREWKESATTLLDKYQTIATSFSFPAGIGEDWVDVLRRGIDALRAELEQLRSAIPTTRWKGDDE